MNTKMQKGYGVPIAILIAGVLIAGAVFVAGRGGDSGTPTSTADSEQEQAGFRVPDLTDHVRGNPDASIVMVEFSDLECPFCARLHPTLLRIVDENDDVKWVYRHFPLSTIHSRALSAAIVSECIAKLGGNDNFWTFVDAAFANQRKLGESWYKEMAASFGIDLEEFATCTDDRSIASNVERDLDEAIGTGGRGTPHVVVISPGGELTSFSGALPYTQVSALIEQARNN